MNIEWSQIADCISDQLGEEVNLKSSQAVSGGCINQAWQVTDQNKSIWFVKMNNPNRISMFEAELLGLQEIIKTQSIRAPKPLCTGQTSQHSFLVMEYLAFKGTPDAIKTGIQLANMHRHSQPTFGWHTDNTIGSTAQVNKHENNWIDFWKKHRLAFQLDLALSKGLPRHNYDSGLALIEQVGNFFEDYQPIASLLHGDLWGGNCSSDENGDPVIYDPAVYFGDRETDLAMTELFGGFSSHFKDSYHEHFPIHDDYRTRKTLYNLYHILNHFNLFGGGYGSQAASMIDSLLSET